MQQFATTTLLNNNNAPRSVLSHTTNSSDSFIFCNMRYILDAVACGVYVYMCKAVFRVNAEITSSCRCVVQPTQRPCCFLCVVTHDEHSIAITAICIHCRAHTITLYCAQHSAQPSRCALLTV